MTVTVNEQVVALSALSFAAYVTVVVPLENVSPELWSDVKLFNPQLSTAVGAVQVALWSHDVLPGPV